MIKKIPQPVKNIIETLNKAGFEAFVVGGCVRDLILEREPKDWDITTDATPEKVIELFPDSFYENDFGTVGVKVERFSAKSRTSDISEAKEHDAESSTDSIQPKTEEKDIIEVTTYRVESEYTDKRRPKKVLFTKSLEEDLARRDFTINAIAYGVRESGILARPAGGKNPSVAKALAGKQESGNSDKDFVLVDPFGGQEDVEKKVIRTVGNPEERFGEDALRLMRAVRFYTELRDPTPPNALGVARETKPTHSWHIEKKTFTALQKLAKNLAHISQERVRDELAKIILSNNPKEGIEMLHTAGLLHNILPELELGIGVTQNLHHIYTVWEHNLRALATCPSQKLETRLAALLHDVGKPQAKRGEGYNSTFYNHDHIGARITEKALTRLRFSKAVVKKATLLVDNHLFYYNVDEVTEASVRRLIKRVGLENMGDLMAVRIGDRLGSGVPKGKPYKLRHLEFMIEKVSKDAVSVKMLKIKGTDLIDNLHIPAGPQIGAILDVLLAEVIENSERNTEEALLKRAEELKDSPIEKLRDLAKEKIEEKRAEDVEQIKKRHWVE
ncbi:MAG: CCA tRNA nucleotidyltransferase [bacterium]|nr:CCA tRNA nucleotidyltransferase [bacterium]